MGYAESTTKESLLPPVERVDNVSWRDLRDGSFTVELKRLICFAAPMAAVVIAQFMVQIVSMMMVGHLGNLALASASLASSFCNVSGFSFIVCFLFLLSSILIHLSLFIFTRTIEFAFPNHLIVTFCLWC